MMLTGRVAVLLLRSYLWVIVLDDGLIITAMGLNSVMVCVMVV